MLDCNCTFRFTLETVEKNINFGKSVHLCELFKWTGSKRWFIDWKVCMFYRESFVYHHAFDIEIWHEVQLIE